jgi:hypothetical protein
MDVQGVCFQIVRIDKRVIRFNVRFGHMSDSYKKFVSIAKITSSVILKSFSKTSKAIANLIILKEAFL